jgi:hypothetical protein
VGLLPALAASAPGAAQPNLDAELIALCDRYIAALHAFNTDPEERDHDDSPLGAAVDALADALDEAPAPRTLAGVLAEARVARFLARQPDGSLEYEDPFTLGWCEVVIEDLLRVMGEGIA